MSRQSIPPGIRALPLPPGYNNDPTIRLADVRGIIADALSRLGHRGGHRTGRAARRRRYCAGARPCSGVSIKPEGRSPNSA